MAVLSQKGNTYHAIGFWVGHQEGLPKMPAGEVLKSYAVSIDELEESTGLYFFCNSPDDLENAVESRFDPADWMW